MVGTNWLGPHGFVLHYPVRRGELMNFVPVVERDDWQIESWVSQGTTRELAHDFRGWHADVHAIIESIETPYRWALMLADTNAVAEAIAQDWLQVRLKERLDWLYDYDVTAIAI